METHVAKKLIILTTDQTGWTSEKLTEAGKKAGFNVEVIDPNNCYINVSDDSYISHDGTKFSEADVCIPRLSEDNVEYKIAIMRHLAKLGVKMVNDPIGMRTATNKLETQIVLGPIGVKVPITIMLTNDEQLDYAVKSLGDKFPIIVKTMFGTHGIGVIRADSMPSLRSIVQQLLKSGTEFLLQECIEHEKSGRIILLNGEVLASSMRTVPKNDFRSNGHLGSKWEKYEPKEEEIAVAKKCAEAVNVNFAAIDYVVEKDGTIAVFEVNGSPGFESMQEITDFDIAEEIMKRISVWMGEAASEEEQDSEEPPVDEKTEPDENVETETEPPAVVKNDEDSGSEKAEAEQSAALPEPPSSIGTVVDCVISNFNDHVPLTARVDTGATHSCIHGEGIKVTDDVVSFKFNGYTYRLHLSRSSKVKNQAGGVVQRPIVKMDITVEGKTAKDVDVSIADRDNMKYDMLLGRSALKELGFSIDVTEEQGVVDAAQ